MRCRGKSEFYSLRRFFVLFLALCCFFATLAKAQEAEELKSKKWIYQQLQERISTARNEQQELRSYLQNAIDNVQFLELQQQKLDSSLKQLKKENAELVLSWKNCSDSLIASQNAYNALFQEKIDIEGQLHKEQQKRKKSLIIGIISGALLTAAGSVAIGVLAAGR